MKLPFHVVAMDLNGQVLVARYSEGEEQLQCEFLAEHLERGVFAVPVNSMIVDGAGEAARVKWDKELAMH